jgi:uncharacterized protein (DUF885 family)
VLLPGVRLQGRSVHLLRTERRTAPADLRERLADLPAQQWARSLRLRRRGADEPSAWRLAPEATRGMLQAVRLPVLAMAVGLAACAPAGAGGRMETTTTTTSAATRALHALFDEEWEYDLRDQPTWASGIGDRRYDDRWPDVSLAAYARRDAHDREVLEKIARVPRDGLSREDALSLEMFRYKYEHAVQGQRFRTWLLAINQMWGVQTADQLADDLSFDTAKHYADWNARLRAFPAYVKQTIELLTEGARAGMTHPRLVMRRVLAQIDGQIAADPGRSGFLKPYAKGKGGPAIPERASLEAEAKRLVAEAVVPAFRDLRAFFEATYLPACKPEVGAWQLPDGAALYAWRVGEETTTAMTPDEVHAVGLHEVARIRGEMERVKAAAGFTGSMKDFFVFLRTDRRFFYTTGAELLEAYRGVAKRVDPELVRIFRRLPRTPYGVTPVPDAIAPDTTTAYYREPAADGSRAGTYYVNLYKPEARPKWEMMALTLHEAVPGHHLQIALALEEQGIPKFRRHAYYNAYLEGWALYAESLGDELGLYDDPYAKFGQLTYEMWRAVRLVVDTGIHHLRWDRQRAIDFFMENAPKAELDVVNEVDRYIVWPAQALAYKIGELRIRELRRKLGRDLGARFDEKAFHDAVLREGAMPLDVLERVVTEGMR